ncbi:hypothetical protein OESDEN_01608 [Oesophagostomum dentatum]|uniref:Reverse transcriptase domain-containing protein n=1 Tax=Oesophagostomum dentatum TaxID=61180 RepID=A0A0B1TLG9_OESDE|nr:hypothetical protein OESDEN_01608 [Oesophagostomum dentatum]
MLYPERIEFLAKNDKAFGCYIASHLEVDAILSKEQRGFIKSKSTKLLVIPVKRGVRQADTISPKLFTTTLQYAMKDLNWEQYGIWIDGKNITNLRFADDIMLCAKNPEEAQKMLDDLDKASKAVGLEKKTQYMKNAWCPAGVLKLEGRALEEVTSYTYLGRSINMDGDLREELGKRRRAAWTALGSIKEITNLLKHRKKIRAQYSKVLSYLLFVSELRRGPTQKARTKR